MESATSISVSVVTVNFNHGHYLDAYICSLNESTYPLNEIIVVDNASSDNSIEILKKYPEVRVIKNETNVGYSEALNQAIQEAMSPLVCATGPDVCVSPDWLQILVATFLEHPNDTFAVASRVLSMEGSNTQSAGGSLHFTGHLNVYDMWKPVQMTHSRGMSVEVGAIDSTSVLFDKKKFLEIGGCDQSFFVYHEEFDYCYRARMRTWKCWFHPDSIVFHGEGTTEFSVRGSGKYPSSRPYFHTKNRLLSVMKNFQARTILGALPIILLVEILNFLILLRVGLQSSYTRALLWLWANRADILRKRQIIQEKRLLGDNLLLTADPLTISPVLLKNPILCWIKLVLDKILTMYWSFMKIILYAI